MNSTIRFFGMLSGFAILLTQSIPQLSNAIAQAQTIQGSETGQLHDAYTKAQGRFIENVGQYPQDIRFIAPGADGWLLFFNDRIEYRKTTMYWNDGAGDGSPDRTIPFMSRKKRHPADYQGPVSHNLHTDTLMQFDDAVLPAGRGMRTERINYFGSTGTYGSVRNAPTWDTLLYSGKGRTVSIFFDKGLAVFEHGGNSKNKPHPLVLESAFDNHPGENLIPEVDGRTTVPLPNIIYSTYLGGSDADAITTAIPLDENRFILIGTTGSRDFPIVGDTFSTELQGDPSSKYSRDVHVTCLDIQRNEILFSTYFGGWDLESLMAATIDAYGNIVFAGNTWSHDLPVTENAWQREYRGNGDGYIAALNSDGSELVFCSYIGGTGIENLKDMKIDAHGNIVVTGLTDSWNYPTTPGVVQSSYGGGEDDIFVTKFNHDVSELIFSTFVGGQ
ncbi:MAG: hypothetical protein KFH87_07115, partial [Bacteroidetes bacterium]|nr:hypothetical protein [Bacteroidota bacterium]